MSTQRETKGYIGLGSNMGDRVKFIQRACHEMERRGIKVLRTSSLWETEAMYFKNQDPFINGIAEVSMFFLNLRATWRLTEYSGG